MVQDNRLARLSRWSACLLVIAAASPAAAATVGGTVNGTDGRPVAGATVRVLDPANRARQATTDADGRFTVEGLPAGSHFVDAQLGNARSGATLIALDGPEAEARVTLALQASAGDGGPMIVISARPRPAASARLVTPVDVVEGDELETKRAPTLGETLADRPGVSSTFFGPGASRPIIRGLADERVRVLENGIGSGDVSDTSPDHAVALNPLAIDRVEIVRGPAAVMYGGSAIGGVVDADTGRIPLAVPLDTVQGAVRGSYGTVNGETAAAFRLDGRHTGLALHADGFRQKAGDYAVPAAAGESDTQLNTSTYADGVGLGAAATGSDAHAGFGFSSVNAQYGIPSQEGVELGKQISLRSYRYDLDAGLVRDLGPFESARLRVGVVDYIHDERARGETEITFDNEAAEGRLELNHKPLGMLEGTVGLQVDRRFARAFGEEEPFLLPTETYAVAGFAFEELQRGDFTHQLGVRVEHVSHDPSGEGVLANAVGRPVEARSFVPVSGALGTVWRPGDEGWAFGVSGSVTQRAPAARELYSNGPHEATGTFEIGDPAFGKETAFGGELSVRKEAGRVRARLSAFGTYFDGYIFGNLTGAAIDVDGEELDELLFEQRDAVFYGGEAEVSWDVLAGPDWVFGISGVLEAVRARLVNGHDLPRIPAAEAGGGLYFQDSDFDARLEARHVFSQNQTAPGERRTGGALVLNASAGYDVRTEWATFDFRVVGQNLLDRRIRNHASFLKDQVLLPGRNVRLIATARF